MAYRFSNRASSLIVVAVTTGSSTVTLEAGGGSKLPILSVGDIVQGTLIAATGVTEIVQVNSVVGDVVDILRGQEGTSVTSFPVGSRFEVRLTARILDNFLQRTGGTMLGDINMNNNTLLNYRQPQAVLLDEIHARVIRSPSVPLSVPGQPGEKFINFTTATEQPTISGQFIVSRDYLLGIVFDWFGDVNNVPGHLKLCDGTNGTPDLRGKFIRSWLPEFGVGGEGGSDVSVTTPAGVHSHGGVTGLRELFAGNLPGHVVTTVTLPVPDGGGSRRFVTSVGVTHDSAAPLHTHSIVVDGNHAHSVNSMPRFYVLAKVMFR